MAYEESANSPFYLKKIYVFDGDKPVPAIIRNYTSEDFEGLIELQQASFPPPFPAELWWQEEQLQNHVELFPEGAICIEIGGKIVGSLTAMRIQIDPLHLEHTWEEITDGGYIRNHDPAGNSLYIVDICILPAFRKMGLGKWLMSSMYETVVYLGITRLIGGGRMPGYAAQAARMTPDQYVDAVVAGLQHDPVLTFLLRCGRMPVQVLPGYLKDEESLNYACLMEWRNPFL
ncbi:GNAT family N-acetyltransferase [Paenibacillus sp. FJAT-26967]|uniref:GNAT family N-acetyltransferase n=1 Tax=Paenibacillus sp. FJAT-26967 TaxID=1729690 RepID=UPI000838D2A5|nr:GNAT family N-acetyltransferase [Paenibacillus sp. FJAT-26967]